MSKECKNQKEKKQPSAETLESGSSREVQQPVEGQSSRKKSGRRLKKPPMRTAMDVVKRILWDELIPEDEITIGYEDRFLGILEKPFTEFSWENLASIDYYTFAIPEHRIQYFKYKDEIIWDKRIRLDNVFGSTFSGITIEEVIEGYPDRHPPVPQGQSGIEGGSGDAPAPGSDADGYDSDGVDVVIGEATEKPSGSSESELDVVEDQYWQDKLRPNFFICQRVCGSDTIDKISAIQSHICEEVPELKDGCIPPNSLHITLRTLRLDNALQVTECMRAMKGAKEELENLLPQSPLHIRGLDNFHGRVIYAAVEPNQELNVFVDHLDLVLRAAGITNADGRDFVPHVTICKLTRPTARKLEITEIRPQLYIDYADSEFGSQAIDSIYLCSMEKTRDSNGFYISTGHVTFMREVV
ncbi:unnamed protein product [Calicophoron daubneyi]|uniref:Leukocyte receptor cluster member 9 n=1 Tax=Calicophoron daubneyi TaxID=300641 RepID=A0AAV2TV54_CALDB